MTAEVGSDGTLAIVVWPAYVGACQGDPSTHTIWEPKVGDYRRGQIEWALENDIIVGRAKILVPQGEYTHLLYFRHPTAMETVGSVQLPHPIVYMGPDNIIEVYPITNDDLQLLKPYKGVS